MDSKSKQELYRLDWEAILPELYAYAYAYRNYSAVWISMTPKDLVNEAVSEVLSGDRKWDSQKHPDISIFMKSVIKSIASHSYEADKARKERILKIAEENSENTAQRQMDECALEEFHKSQLDEIENRIKSHDDLMLLFLEMKDGHFSDIDLAQVLGITIKDVRNLKKRLRRKIVDLKKQWEENEREAKKIEE